MKLDIMLAFLKSMQNLVEQLVFSTSTIELYSLWDSDNNQHSLELFTNRLLQQELLILAYRLSRCHCNVVVSEVHPPWEG